MAIRKELLVRVGLYDEEFTGWGREDNELGFRLFHEGAHFHPNLKAVAYHLDHDVNLKKIKREVAKTTALFKKKTSVYVPVSQQANPFYKQNIQFVKENGNIRYYYAT